MDTQKDTGFTRLDVKKKTRGIDIPPVQYPIAEDKKNNHR